MEKVTGRSYATEIERRILRPLHLTGTRLPGTDPRLPRPSGRAYAVLADDPERTVHDVTELNATMAGAAGSMISDAADLNRFFSALLTGRLLPPAQLKEMKTTVALGSGEDGEDGEAMRLRTRAGEDPVVLRHGRLGPWRRDPRLLDGRLHHRRRHPLALLELQRRLGR